MNFKEQVEDIVNKTLTEREDLFLIDLTLSESKKITIVIDGDHGVNLQDCIDLSRSVESQFEDDLEFSIDVYSAGISLPLKFSRQYKKNIGRQLKLKLNDNTKIEGKVTQANDESVTLQWSTREPKKIGKGKETVEHNQSFSYDTIKEALVIISF